MRFITWTFLILLIAIHSLDMELTRYYIGNNAQSETFPPMRWAIGNFGIDTALWISRAIMYPYYFMTLMNQDKRVWRYALILMTILYWTAMVPWVFQLQLLKWPFAGQLVGY